ncbi:YlxR family protein [Thermodesulfobacteriota bacterium]
MKKGHIPVRQCIACRRRRPKKELIRLSALEERVVISGEQANNPGRGCYVCPREECVAAALVKGRLEKALRRRGLLVPSKEELLRRLD